MIKLDRAVKDKKPKYDGRHDKVILQHIAKPVQETLLVLYWEILPHRHIYQTLLHPTTICFDPCTVPFRGSLQFTKMGRPMDSFQGTIFFYRRINLLPEKWKNVVLFNLKYFEWNIFYFIISISALLFIKKLRELSCKPNTIAYIGFSKILWLVRYFWACCIIIYLYFLYTFLN